MYAIETKGLSKHYQGKPALDNLDLKVRVGEVYGFIGRNGAGKTTTINLLLSLIHRTEGDILIQGQEVRFGDMEYKRQIGYVPDVPMFPEYMNAAEYITYACEMNDVPKEEIPSKITEVLAFVDLPDHHKKIGAYSRGMKQRLAIAQALVHDPSIIIMDEPTSALDPIGRKDVIRIIQKLKGNKTIFYSTHILEDVEKVCDRIGLLEQGKLILEDTIAAIQKRFYQNKMILKTEEPITELRQLATEQRWVDQVEWTDQYVICDRQDDVADRILKTVLDAGFHVMEYRPQNASLEDVFIEVTHG
jgi:ABC-2 type transport system ATP-binding protein